MNIAKIKYNDTVNGEGISVSLWFQGCPFHCYNCHNSETWRFGGGIEWDTEKLIAHLIKAIGKNGIIRNFSVLGGEPFCSQNRAYAYDIVTAIRKAYPDISICLWTGYAWDKLQEEKSVFISGALESIDYLIEGLYVDSERNLSLKWRGSNNQHIWKRSGNTWNIIE